MEHSELESNSPDYFSPSRWIIGFCVVHFDTELGQVVESSVPFDCLSILSKEENINLGFLSFPDSNCGSLDSSVHSFRILTNRGAIFGSSYFQQLKDSNADRGYSQRSVVLLSVHPYFTLMEHVIRRIGPHSLEKGLDILEQAYSTIMNEWETHCMGNHLLSFDKFGGGNLSVVIDTTPPCSWDIREDQYCTRDTFGTSNIPLHSNIFFSDMGIYSNFVNVLPILWHLWELVLIGEPLLLYSSSPNECSSAVLSLLSMICPIQYYGDFRPYFTIHDPDFKPYSNLPLSGTHHDVVIGVTNPFFLKAYNHWPHVLSLGGKSDKGLKTSRKSRIDTPKGLVEKTEGKTAHECDILLRTHFLSLTERFLMPLERHITSLMPLLKDVVAFKPLPTLKNFDQKICLKACEKDERELNEILGAKGDWMAIYKRFLDSANFGCWLHGKQTEIEHVLRNRWINEVDKFDVNATMIREKSEVKKVDLFLRIKESLENERARNPKDESVLSLTEEKYNQAKQHIPGA